MMEEDEEYQEDEPIAEQEGMNFSLFLQEQLQYMPWWILSIIIHTIILCIMFLTISEDKVKEIEIKIPDIKMEQVQEEIKIEKKPDQFKQEKEVPVEQENPQVQDPIVKEAKVSDHNETANQEDFKMSKGKSDFVSDSPFEGKFTNNKIGIGGGAGGMFGDRFGGRENLVARGGSQKTEDAVLKGLQWLKRHQNPDGSWGANGFSQCCNRDPKYPGKCDGAGAMWADTGVTGLALLCFLGAGNSTTIGDFQDQVRDAVQYLTRAQDSDGCFGKREAHYMYNHSIATLAMAEAYSLSNYNAMIKTPAQKAVDFLCRAQNPNKAWRYTYQSGDNDTSVTGWCVMALKSAKAAGLTISETAFSSTKAFLDSITDTKYYRTGYTELGNAAGIAESMTAVAMTARVFMGSNKNDPYLVGGAGLLQTNYPVWKDDKSTIDYYYWYYGTLAMYQLGGDYWISWNDKMKAALLDSQEKEGCASGSWPAYDRWCSTGGRVYATAVNVLSLEIYYRYAKVFK